MNENQQAIVAFSRLLEARLADAPEAKVQQMLTSMEGVQAQFRVVQDRVRLFLEQQHARAGAPGRP
jgi:hypothetical protein